MKVKVLKKNSEAKIPQKAYEGDFCYDVYAVSEEEVAPNVWKYGLGLAFQIERGFQPILSSNDEKKMKSEVSVDFSKSPMILSLDFRPRSSVWKTGMVMSNCEGTVDEFYRGECFAVFYQIFPNMPRYRVGDKIAQMKLGATLPIEFEEVDSLDDTKRGDKGFGSSGLR